MVHPLRLFLLSNVNYCFYRRKKVPGPLALVKVTFLFLNADLSTEELLIGLTVLQHLDVSTKPLSEQSHDVLNGSDCSSIGNSSTVDGGGYVSRLIIARTNQVEAESKTPDEDTEFSRPRVDYFKVCKEKESLWMHLYSILLIAISTMRCLRLLSK